MNGDERRDMKKCIVCGEPADRRCPDCYEGPFCDECLADHEEDCESEHFDEDEWYDEEEEEEDDED